MALFCMDESDVGLFHPVDGRRIPVQTVALPLGLLGGLVAGCVYDGCLLVLHCGGARRFCLADADRLCVGGVGVRRVCRFVLEVGAKKD